MLSSGKINGFQKNKFRCNLSDVLDTLGHKNNFEESNNDIEFCHEVDK